jgi:chromate transporter
VRWVLFGIVGAIAAATVGPYLVLVLVVCGLAEVVARADHRPRQGGPVVATVPMVTGHVAVLGGFGALAWVALKVGALSYGGGFVIVPLIQHDAVTTYHWMTGGQFLNAVALGQVTPGPVVHTVAVVGYAAGGLVGGLVAALVAFAPSFLFVLVGGPHFDRLRRQGAVEAFLTGAGPAAIGAIAGSAIPLGLELQHLWQVPVLGGALVWFFAARRHVVSGLIAAGVVGVTLSLAGVGV